MNVARLAVGEGAFRPGHVLGNHVLGGLLSRLFGRSFEDVLSGYKACSRRLVKSFPVSSTGFEIETELVVHALQLDSSVHELSGPYKARQAGSASKLATWSDGRKILMEISRLVRHGRPLAFFSAIGGILAIIGIVLGVPVLTTFIRTGPCSPFPHCHPRHGVGGHVGPVLCDWA